jgi:hypothetical protein
MSATWTSAHPSEPFGTPDAPAARRRPPHAPPTDPPFAAHPPVADPPRADTPERARRIRRLQGLADLMDSAFVLPGTSVRFGLDPILGLLPGAGDLITSALSLYIVVEGWRIGATRKQLGQMVLNVAIDTALGAVPIAGDVADFAFKANRRNLAILGITPRRRQAAPPYSPSTK